MILDEHFEEYIRLCIRIIERMERENSWPDIITEPPKKSIHDKQQ